MLKISEKQNELPSLWAMKKQNFVLVKNSLIAETARTQLRVIVSVIVMLH